MRILFKEPRLTVRSQMHKLCLHYGPPTASIPIHATPAADATCPSSSLIPTLQTFHCLPPPSALSGADVESHLRVLGFGYRAKYLHRTAALLSSYPSDWLDSLRNPESPAYTCPTPSKTRSAPASNSSTDPIPPEGRPGYRAAHSALLDLQGVGPKVADCVCLMGLGWGEAVPVDTHVWAIAQRDYRFRAGGAKGKGVGTLTKALYDAVGDHFRGLWGKEAGWAHSVLFTADLRAFSVQEKREEVQVVKGEEIIVKLEEEQGAREEKKQEGVTPPATPLTVSKAGVKRKRNIGREVVKEEVVRVVAAGPWGSTKDGKAKAKELVDEDRKGERRVKKAKEQKDTVVRKENRMGVRSSLRVSLRESVEGKA